MINKYTNKHNYVKNPNWQEADQLAIYKRGREVEPRGYRDQHQLVVRTGFEPATYGFQIRRSNHSATLPPHLNNRVFLSRNYRLIVAPRKFDVLKTNMLVLRTSNFQGATIRPIVPRDKHSIVFIVHH